jgi:hypothetical protein
MLFGEIIAVYCRKHAKEINTMCAGRGGRQRFLPLQLVVHIITTEL